MNFADRRFKRLQSSVCFGELGNIFVNVKFTRNQFNKKKENEKTAEKQSKRLPIW